MGELIEVKNKVLQRGIHYLTSPYGERILNGKTEFHEGVDLVSYYDGKTTIDYVVCFADGVVTYNGYNGNRGYCVTIRHDGDIETIYQHLKYKSILKLGMEVKKGWVVALMGSSGKSTADHLHFGVYKDGEWVDPMPYLEMDDTDEAWNWAIDNDIVPPNADRKELTTREAVVEMLYRMP